MFSVNLCREDGGGSAFCFPPYSTRLECPTICRLYNRGSTFYFMILKPRVLIQCGEIDHETLEWSDQPIIEII